MSTALAVKAGPTECLPVLHALHYSSLYLPPTCPVNVLIRIDIHLERNSFYRCHKTKPKSLAAKYKVTTKISTMKKQSNAVKS